MVSDGGTGGTADILLATVPHTGTRFFIGLIEEAIGIDHHIMRARTEPELNRYRFATCHIEEPNSEFLEKYIETFDPLLIVTDRNPDEVAISWAKRGLDLERLDECRRIQQEIITRHDPLIVSVDAADREQKLGKLGQAIGEQLATNWQPVGSWPDIHHGPKPNRH